nr:hypothetical protein [Thermosynechococcus sp. M98_K2018_005]
MSATAAVYRETNLS